MQNERPKLNKAVLIFLLCLFLFPALIYYIVIVEEQERWDDLQLLLTATKPNRGTPSERAFIMKLLKSGFNGKAIFHDIYIQKKDSTYSQIDVVLATKVGLIAIEIKDYAGWIYGNVNKKNWTQVLAYGREKYPLYNPIFQNARHIDHLKRALPREKMPIYNVIIFYGNSVFREMHEVPNDVYLIKDYQALNVVNHIQNSNPPAEYTDKHEIMRVLGEAVANGDNPNIVYAHANYVHSIKNKHIA